MLRRRRKFLGSLQIILRVSREAGIAVDATKLQRHPIGADVAFFENMYWDMQATAHGYRGTMQRATVSEEQHVRDLSCGNNLSQRIGPLIRPPREVNSIRQTPKQTVSAVEIDLPHAVAIVA